MKRLAMPPRWMPALVLVIGLGLSVAAGVHLHLATDEEMTRAFKHRVDLLADIISDQFIRPVDALSGMGALFAAQPKISQEQFARYVQAWRLAQELPGVRGYSWIPRVPRERLDAYLAAQRQATGDGFRLHSLGDDSQPDLYPVQWIEPRPANIESHGLDLGSEARRRDAVQRAAQSGLPTLSTLISLVQDRQRRNGFLLMVPHYGTPLPPSTPAGRVAALEGVLVAPIVAAELLEPVVSQAAGELQFEIVDPQAASGPAVIYASSESDVAQAAATAASAPPQALRDLLRRLHLADHDFDLRRPLRLVGHDFELRVRTMPGLEARAAHSGPAWVLLVGMAFSTLLAALVWQQSDGRRRAVALARQMTAELDRTAMVARLTSNAVIITDAHRRVTWVNAGFERLTGYTAAEVLGCVPGALLQFEGTDPGTVARLRTALRAGQPFHCELLNRGKTGRIYWLDVEIQPLRDAQGVLTGFVGIESDITQRVQAQAAQRASEAEARRNDALMRGAIDAIDEAFVLYDPDDRLVFCNDKYLAIYATSADLIVPGARFEDIVRQGALRGQYAAAVGRVDEWVAERMVAHRSGSHTLIQTLDDGRTLRIVERKMPDGHLVGFRIDITDLVRATEAAEEGNRAKSDFIATMSHELRTPLQSINGFSELGQHMAQAEGQTQFASMFGRVMRNGEHMLSLVNDLLDLSVIDAASLALTRKPEDLRALARQVCEELEPLAQARDLRFEWSPSMPVLPVDGDSGRLQQVIRNVLANAIRFAPAGSVVQIDGADLGNQGIELTVRDHGPGIPPDELELVFDAFVQSSRTRDGSGGTGLGLAISRRIMTAHGGHITAENGPQAGTLLRLRLPAVRLQFDQAQPISSRPVSAPMPAAAPPTTEPAA